MTSHQYIQKFIISFFHFSLQKTTKSMSIIPQKESVSAPFITLAILPSNSYPLVAIPSEPLQERLVHYQMENTGM